MAERLRNLAIIAHVDHGKTTLVDQLLAQGGAFRANEARQERAMDSNDQERERGITILAKCTSILWSNSAGEEYRLNIVDTPGHADFGGEVERILGMVDGCVILVDASEGVMPQTKFVLSKALARGLRPMVVLNKVDRPSAEPDKALNEIFELFLALGASDEQADFPILYASGKEGWAKTEMAAENKDLTPLFELIVRHVPDPEPVKRRDEQFAFLVTMIDSDPFLGRMLTGRVESGRVKVGDPVRAITRDGKEIEKGRLTKLLSFRGLKRVPVESAEAGDIIAIAGLVETTVADTIGSPELAKPIPAPPIDPPTLAITVSINDSPLAGRAGDKVQSRVIRARLLAEAESNVAIRVTETSNKDAYEVAGRGELQLGVLVETMRREGFELSLSRPKVLTRSENGQTLEPVEEVVIDVDDEYTGVVIEKMSIRKAELQDMRPSGGGKTRLVMLAPSRGMVGYHGEFLTDTRGSGVMNRLFHSWAPWKGDIPGRRNGALISNDKGQSTAYALWNLEERGQMFIADGEDVYEGMIIGENSRGEDLDVNPLKGKKLTNVRASGKDESIRLTPPRRLTLEQAMAWIEDDELVEVTPAAIRLRKAYLDPNERKKQARAKEAG
ncbi:MAG TPA: translational GTPase TypA [Vitreimonas sp.]|uniref:translational GTPase TypA n=1 Tax=Vitreimonas sp. TaxID=3069702 RepID=UPI002D2FA281|nr:translational GTPase TypA [Vitreimonas sp.]HYD89839.1 translational GTPase TypA [Vitreimonas sp.]